MSCASGWAPHFPLIPVQLEQADGRAQAVGSGCGVSLIKVLHLLLPQGGFSLHVVGLALDVRGQPQAASYPDVGVNCRLAAESPLTNFRPRLATASRKDCGVPRVRQKACSCRARYSRSRSRRMPRR